MRVNGADGTGDAGGLPIGLLLGQVGRTWPKISNAQSNEYWINSTVFIITPFLSYPDFFKGNLKAARH